MKRKLFIVAILGILTACQKDPEIPVVSLTVQDNVEAEWLSASLSGSAVANTKIDNLYVQVSTDESFGSYTETEAQYESGQFVLALTGLTPQSTYYYRYRVANKINAYTDQQAYTFKTKDYIAPIVMTDSVNHITGKKARLFGTVAFDCGKEIKEQGFEYGPDESHLTKVVADTTGFTKQMLQLQFGTQYVFRAYATSEIGTGYGEIKTFQTCDAVKFGEVKVSEIKANSAYAEYTIASDDDIAVLKKGLQYWKKGAKDSVQVETNKAATFTNLENGQKYQLRAFAVTEDSCFYSAVSEFTTKNGVITLITSTPTDVKYTTATLGGQITDDEGITITERGVCWSTQSNPTTAHSKQIANSNTFSVSVSNLIDGTTYYVRAYAVNQYGTYYGEEKTFTTTAYLKPFVLTFSVTNISNTSATCGGNITSDGGATITERGVCYATTTNPTISDTKVTGGTGTGIFYINLIGLTDGTTYYVRVYATNSKGTSYGEVKSFTTTGAPSGVEMVDLGLSVKWANMNVGATTVTGYGNYYAWGEISPKTDYSWITYKHCNGSYNSLTKYCNTSIYGMVDNKTILEAEDDAAHVNWGGNWRMPTHAEQQELVNNCTVTWTTNYQGTGVAGCIFTSKKTGYTDRSIFLPAAGSMYYTYLNDAQSQGKYLSSSLMGNSTGYASNMDFNSASKGTAGRERYLGMPVRAVCP